MLLYPDDDQNPKDEPASAGDEEILDDDTDGADTGKEDGYLDDGIEESDEVE